MPQRAVEIILMRQLASYLAMPIFIVDPAGTLVFYNEPAETILGRRFEETGEMPLEEWSTLFDLTAEDGSPIPLQARPLMIALQKRQAGARAFWLQESRRHPPADRGNGVSAGGPGGTGIWAR